MSACAGSPTPRTAPVRLPVRPVRARRPSGGGAAVHVEHGPFRPHGGGLLLQPHNSLESPHLGGHVLGGVLDHRQVGRAGGVPRHLGVESQ